MDYSEWNKLFLNFNPIHKSRNKESLKKYLELVNFSFHKHSKIYSRENNYLQYIENCLADMEKRVDDNLIDNNYKLEKKFENLVLDISNFDANVIKMEFYNITTNKLTYPYTGLKNCGNSRIIFLFLLKKKKKALPSLKIIINFSFEFLLKK